LLDGTTIRASRFIGMAPNFFAGITLTWWQAYAINTLPYISVAYALAILVLGGGDSTYNV
jgi:hypothetical protein